VPLVEALVSTEALVELLVPLVEPLVSTEALGEPLVSIETLVDVVAGDPVSRAWATSGSVPPRRPATPKHTRHASTHRGRRRPSVLLTTRRRANGLSGSCNNRPPSTGSASRLPLVREVPPRMDSNHKWSENGRIGEVRSHRRREVSVERCARTVASRSAAPAVARHGSVDRPTSPL
jgi:hypothetical protein